MFNFEKLETWHAAIAFADMVYTLTRDFPDAERFGLTNQMRRAAVSISSNVAEGCSRSSRVDYARFVEIATGSVFEVVSQSTPHKKQLFDTPKKGDLLERMLLSFAKQNGWQLEAWAVFANHYHIVAPGHMIPEISVKCCTTCTAFLRGS